MRIITENTKTCLWNDISVLAVSCNQAHAQSISKRLTVSEEVEETSLAVRAAHRWSSQHEATEVLSPQHVTLCKRICMLN